VTRLSRKPVDTTADRPAGTAIVATELVAVLAAVTRGAPRVLTTHGGTALPAGPFQMVHRSLQGGLQAWVETQTHHPIGYVEQLYTFADRDRADLPEGQRIISISYLGLTREVDASATDAHVQAAASPKQLHDPATRKQLHDAATRKQLHDAASSAQLQDPASGAASWQDWYRYFPWEDRRSDPAPALMQVLHRALSEWERAGADPASRRKRHARAAITFGLDDFPWNEELVLQRYELLFEAGAVAESGARGLRMSAHQVPGMSMLHDYRRMMATGMARLRAKIKYRPVVFELMPESFTLLQLQQTVEALAGRTLHKQNFRRLIEQQALVEETGESSAAAAGRPAKLFRFRSEVVLERAFSGTKLPLTRQP